MKARDIIWYFVLTVVVLLAIMVAIPYLVMG